MTGRIPQGASHLCAPRERAKSVDILELPLFNHLSDSFGGKLLPGLHILRNELFALERREALCLKVVEALTGQLLEQLDLFHVLLFSQNRIPSRFAKAPG